MKCPECGFSECQCWRKVPLTRDMSRVIMLTPITGASHEQVPENRRQGKAKADTSLRSSDRHSDGDLPYKQ